MIEYNRFKLANGLRVVHHYDGASAMVAVNVMYNVGARDERRELTGIAHLFEHLMFGGSVNIPEFDSEIERAGGVNNAWTSNDFTDFHDLVPAQNVETAFYLESDRMLSLAFNPHALEVQRSVVIEEFKQQCLNRPYGDLMHHLRRLAYGEQHPYGWPVIGLKPEHIAAVTDEDVRQWFFSHYAPDNAVLAVAGNITLEETQRLAEKWFAEIPNRSIKPRNLPAPAFPKQDIVETVYGDVPQSMVMIAIPMAKYGTKEFLTADVLSDLLALGRSSRLFRNLVIGGNGLFTSADASIAGSEHEGMFLINARINEDSDEAIAEARRLLLEEARRLAEPGEVTPDELERTLNHFEATFMFSNMDCESKALTLAQCEMHGEDVNETVARQRSVTLDDIVRVARQLFIDTPSVTLNYRVSEK
jgi:predicted Zn-dependent peptidase